MPRIIILAGPNGAGKSTSAPGLLSQETVFLNADEIAKGLTDVPSQSRDVQAGRLLLRRLEELENEKADIAVETTLASRTLAPRIARLQATGYRFYLFFFWLPSPEMPIERVAARVRSGGHHIPDPVIRRRYVAGLRNFYKLYYLLANICRMYDNTQAGAPALIAKGTQRVQNMALWNQIKEFSKDADRNPTEHDQYSQNQSG
jgi:predicted ABC-type ATPase